MYALSSVHPATRFNETVSISIYFTRFEISATLFASFVDNASEQSKIWSIPWTELHSNQSKSMSSSHQTTSRVFTLLFALFLPFSADKEVRLLCASNSDRWQKYNMEGIQLI